MTTKTTSPTFKRVLNSEKITIFKDLVEQLLPILNAMHPDEGDLEVEGTNEAFIKQLGGTPEEYEKVMPYIVEKSTNPWAFLQFKKGRTKSTMVFSHPGLKELVLGNDR